MQMSAATKINLIICWQRGRRVRVRDSPKCISWTVKLWILKRVKLAFSPLMRCHSLVFHLQVISSETIITVKSQSDNIGKKRRWLRRVHSHLPYIEAVRRQFPTSYSIQLAEEPQGYLSRIAVYCQQYRKSTKRHHMS